MEQLRRTTASEELFRALRDEILAGRYAPGEKLPPQRALAREYGLNATTVREAIKRLEQLRLVDVRHGDAMRVADWRSASGLDVLAHVLVDASGPRPDALRAVMEARRWMLAAAAHLAAGRRSDAQARALRELAAAAGAARDAAAAQAADFAFFAQVIEASSNVVFTLIVNSIRDVYFEHTALFAPMTAPEAGLAPLYARAAEAIAGGDAEEAERAVGELAAAQERALEAALG
jgi:DNA-binding FadR family transcriptional regulator